MRKLCNFCRTYRAEVKKGRDPVCEKCIRKVKIQIQNAKLKKSSPDFMAIHKEMTSDEDGV